MNSMTGFGYVEGEGAGVHLSAEIKSLNTRYLDLIVSLPPFLSMLESRIRERLQERFARGRLELSVKARDIGESLTITVDQAVAGKWKKALDTLAVLLGGDQQVSLDMLTRQDGVLKIHRARDTEAYWTVLEPLLTTVCDQVSADRKREGRNLARDIESQIALIRESLAGIADRAPEIKGEVEEALRSRFREILGDQAGEQRVLMETAAWIAKMDINEEIVRLEAHIAAFREEAANEGPKGKKLDFLVQEMGREINTIGAKMPRADVGRGVVEMKDALEKLREQLRNVE